MPYLEKMRVVGDVAQYAVQSKKFLNRKTMMKEGGRMLLSCKRCKVAKYCSVKFQKVHWKVHKRDCKEVVAKEEACGKEVVIERNEFAGKEEVRGAAVGDKDLGGLSKAMEGANLE